ncbi:polyprenyl synthetase family protein [Nocardia sp. NPDC003482]
MTVFMTNSSGSLRHTKSEMMNSADEQALSFLAAERARWSELDENAIAPIDAVIDLVRAGGKRIRPEFCISGYLAAGGDAGLQSVISAAIALEFLHTFALIHDDIIDDSSWRRGAATVHEKHAAEHRLNHWRGESRRFGESVGILSGNLALIYADDFMSDAAPNVADVWVEMRAELIIGQYLDVLAAARFSGDARLSRLIAQVKSGNYTIHRPLVIGALLAGRPDLADAFRSFGVAVGEAFQLRDDLLDLLGDAETTGKPAHLDFAQHKMTLLLSLAIERDPDVREMVTDPAATPEKLHRLLMESGICAEVESHIDKLMQLGHDAIACVRLEPGWREELAAMAHAVAYRKR